jgi:hypothetical protein
MHHLQLFFRGRSEPILVPVREKDGRSVLDYLRDRTDATDFVTFESIVEHQIWISGTSLQMARFLLEMDVTPFSSEDIQPSRQFPEEESEEPDLLDIHWQVMFWLHGRSEPVIVSEVHGGDWVEIYTSLDCDEQFIVITDEDGEELVLRIADIDMICGLEVDRYSTEQREPISDMIHGQA